MIPVALFFTPPKRVLHFALSLTCIVVGLLASNLLAQQVPLVARPSNPKLIRFELRMSGLRPKSVTVEEGRHEIRFENALVRADLELQVDDSRRQTVSRTQRRPGEKARVKDQFLVNLSPGTYTVSIVGQPNWRSEIVVTAKAR